MNGRDRFVPIGHEQVADVSAAVGLTVPTGAQFALLQAETKNIRFRDDGTDPTAAIGQILVAGLAPFWYAGNLSALSFIQAEATAKLNVSYYG